MLYIQYKYVFVLNLLTNYDTNLAKICRQLKHVNLSINLFLHCIKILAETPAMIAKGQWGPWVPLDSGGLWDLVTTKSNFYFF